MIRELPASTAPAFCRSCGTALVRREDTIPGGYHPVTGAQEPGRPHVTLSCPRHPSGEVWVLQEAGTPSARWVAL